MWLKTWMKNVVSNPKTTLAGIGSLVGAAALGYGMFAGAVPLNAQTIATTGGLASAGFAGLLGTDAGGQQAAQVLDSLTGQAVTITPAALGVMEQIRTMKQEAAAGQAKVNDFQLVAGALAQMAAASQPATNIPPPDPEPKPPVIE